MVLRKVLWLWVFFDGNDSYIFLGFAIVIILLLLVTWLTILANIQIITLLNFV